MRKKEKTRRERMSSILGKNEETETGQTNKNTEAGRDKKIEKEKDSPSKKIGLELITLLRRQKNKRRDLWRERETVREKE